MSSVSLSWIHLGSYRPRRNPSNLDVSLNAPMPLIPVWDSKCLAIPGQMTLNDFDHYGFAMSSSCCCYCWFYLGQDFRGRTCSLFYCDQQNLINLFVIIHPKPLVIDVALTVNYQCEQLMSDVTWRFWSFLGHTQHLQVSHNHETMQIKVSLDVGP